jgi:hypothetical protein
VRAALLVVGDDVDAVVAARADVFGALAAAAARPERAPARGGQDFTSKCHRHDGSMGSRNTTHFSAGVRVL